MAANFDALSRALAPRSDVRDLPPGVLVATMPPLGIAESKDIRVWDRFAHNELKGRKGFGDVLRQTLYRPRDLLTLLNRAYQVAQNSGRSEIIPADVDEAALTNSQNRLDDLVKEYEQVLPGTSNFVRAFQGTPDRVSYREALDCIARCSAQAIDDAGHTFALLGSADEVFVALYSIGLLGLEVAPGEFEYCHDGTFSSTKAIPDSQNVAIHPCYGRALGLTPSGLSVQVTQLVTDDEQPDRSAGEDESDNSAVVGRMRDQRVRQLGRVLTELDQITPGAEHAAKFEEWLYTAVRILFSGPLTNPELHPNKSAALRRDVVATNAASTGFWKRLRYDYQCRQVVFEAKNYLDLGPTEFKSSCRIRGPFIWKGLVYCPSRANGVGSKRACPHKVALLRHAASDRAIARRVAGALHAKATIRA